MKIVNYLDDSQQLSFFEDTKLFCIINNSPIVKASLINNIEQTYSICDNIIINYNPPPDMGKHILLYVNQTDIDASVNNIVRKLHNLNASYVDVSVFDHNNKEIMIGLSIVNANEIDLDFFWKIPKKFKETIGCN